MSVLVLYIHGKKMTQINHNMLNGCHLPLIFNVMSTPPLILIFKQFVHLPLIFNVLPPPPYINFRRFVHLPLIFHVPLILGIKEYSSIIHYFVLAVCVARGWTSVALSIYLDFYLRIF